VTTIHEYVSVYIGYISWTNTCVSTAMMMRLILTLLDWFWWCQLC